LEGEGGLVESLYPTDQKKKEVEKKEKEVADLREQIKERKEKSGKQELAPQEQMQLHSDQIRRLAKMEAVNKREQQWVENMRGKGTRKKKKKKKQQQQQQQQQQHHDAKRAPTEDLKDRRPMKRTGGGEIDDGGLQQMDVEQRENVEQREEEEDEPLEDCQWSPDPKIDLGTVANGEEHMATFEALHDRVHYGSDSESEMPDESESESAVDWEEERRKWTAEKKERKAKKQAERKAEVKALQMEAHGKFRCSEEEKCAAWLQKRARSNKMNRVDKRKGLTDGARPLEVTRNQYYRIRMKRLRRKGWAIRSKLQKTMTTFKQLWATQLTAMVGAGGMIIAPKLNFHSFGYLNPTVARTLQINGFCSFVDRELLQACKRKGIFLLITGESHSTKTCDECFTINFVGSRKTYFCKNCKHKAPRDGKSTISIFERTGANLLEEEEAQH
jgi:hypothetical protein